ncbi:ribosomal protein L32p, Zinc-binding ribosomal protein [Artemisia annua]|uniref:Large ribosomal subunit protein bL32m n=1 Tax=Artemisia annua TaxID=35608 RepID=A0A2U1QG43_ARTAN|nr:ribosomal protein L32p, Zinc-binding ribosomal protein [Artemisia annua]
MALLRTATLNTKASYTLAFNRCIHTFYQPLAPPQPAALDVPISHSAASPPLFFPETERGLDSIINGFGSGFHIGSGSMELMAVPKKKTSPHKRGIRNGPKALKPIPVIIRCKVCGRVKLPHFFCCSGLRDTDAPNGSTS